MFYCSVDCQRKDWKLHKPLCFKNEGAEEFIRKSMEDKTLCRDDFEVFKKLGDGNFTSVNQVFHKNFPDRYFALKECQI